LSKRTLSAFLSLCLLFLGALPAHADVTGSFTVDVTLEPRSRATEAVEFFIDLQANLQTNFTLSGLTFGADVGFGVTGVEFAVLNLATNLGALRILDQFVFATPFGCEDFAAGGGDDTSGGIGGQCRGSAVVPIGDGNGDGIADDAVGFVKKRVEVSLNVAGITLGNLVLIEDVDFPDIEGVSPVSGKSDHEHDHFTGPDVYDLSDNNAALDDAVPTFGFGDVLTLSGQTVSGINVTHIVGFCADAQDVNRIKKRSFSAEVAKHCLERPTATRVVDEWRRADRVLAAEGFELKSGQRLRTAVAGSVCREQGWDDAVTPEAVEIPMGPLTVVHQVCARDLDFTGTLTEGDQVGAVVADVVHGGGAPVTIALELAGAGLAPGSVDRSVPGGEHALAAAGDPGGNDHLSAVLGRAPVAWVAGTIGPIDTDDDASDQTRAVTFDLALRLGRDAAESAPADVLFSVQKLRVEDLALGPVALSAWLEFRPLAPARGTLEADVNVAGLAHLGFTFESHNLAAPEVDALSMTLQLDNLTLRLEDFNGDLEVDEVTASLALTLNAEADPSTFAVRAVVIPGAGISEVRPVLTVRQQGFGLSVTSLFQGGGALTWFFTDFDAQARLDALRFGAHLRFTSEGFETGGFSAGLVF